MVCPLLHKIKQPTEKLEFHTVSDKGLAVLNQVLNMPKRTSHLGAQPSLMPAIHDNGTSQL